MRILKASDITITDIGCKECPHCGKELPQFKTISLTEEAPKIINRKNKKD